MAVLRVLFLNWRDTRHPEGGGSEVYVENVARSLAAAGHQVTIFCAMYGVPWPTRWPTASDSCAPGRSWGVYREAVLRMRRRAFGELDVIIDVQNGIPFMSRAVVGPTPVVVLVHHVHGEQWPVVYDPLRSKIGWWVESVLAPRLYRNCTYVAVSDKTRRNSVNWAYSPAASTSSTTASSRPRPGHRRSEHPHIAVVGRLVPHKRVEHVLRAAAILRRRHPTCGSPWSATVGGRSACSRWRRRWACRIWWISWGSWMRRPNIGCTPQRGCWLYRH